MRTLSGAASAALSSSRVTIATLVEMMLTQPIRLNSSPVNLPWGGYDWLGAGNLGAIDEVKDSPGERKPLRFSLSAVPSDQLSLALQEPVRNRICNVYLAILDNDTQQVVDAPLTWTGTLSHMPIEQTGDTAVISVIAAHAMDTMGRIKPLRYTDADQRRLFAGDTSLRFVVSQANHQDIWPAASFFRQ